MRVIDWIRTQFQVINVYQYQRSFKTTVSGSHTFENDSAEAATQLTRIGVLAECGIMGDRGDSILESVLPGQA